MLRSLGMVRRILSLYSLLGLLLLTPTPLSICALLADLPGECTQPSVQPDCEQMEMVQPSVVMKAGGDLSCCQISQAPIPEAPGKVVASQASVETLRPDHLVVLPQPDRLAHSEVAPAVSPPDRQQLLCVFLI